MGACATSGGIQALRAWAGNDGGIAGFIDAVYATPEYIDTLATATPVADHVDVDAELRGCPIDTRQLVELLLRHGVELSLGHLERIERLGRHGNPLPASTHLPGPDPWPPKPSGGRDLTV